MTKYLLSRILRGIISIIIVVGIVMVLLFTLIDKSNIFMQDTVYTKKQGNDREVYKYQCWDNYGYLDYVSYGDYLVELEESGEIDRDTKFSAAVISNYAADDSPLVAEYVARFRSYYEAKGYTFVRLEAIFQNASTGALKQGGAPYIFVYKNAPVIVRLWEYFSHLITVDNINYVEEPIDNRGLTFTFFDPLYGGTKFSPAIIGNGTQHKYLLYFDSSFPFIHQNLFSINLGKSYSINTGVDVYDTMTQTQGSIVKSEITFPAGYVGQASVDLHTATYSSGSYSTWDGEKWEVTNDKYYTDRYVDNYTLVNKTKASFSKTGFSFVIGIISTFIAYVVGIPLGMAMAVNKDKLIDKLGTIYIIFIIAVPSLAYIFMFRAIGKGIGLPTTFDVDKLTPLMYVLPIVSLALPSIGGFMKWVRRYMIDQMNSDYVKFARSGGLTESEVFRKHILKNAIIPIVHGIPGAILGSVVGGIITEGVYSVPGTGGMLVKAINYFDNGAIIGLTLFYSTLTVVSLILGDILMALVDPRISFTSKGR
ncbi:MAG: ABC transporter permease [Clostridia bacterium]|nr:ABC transporter permease [Clostridia bacterium]